MLYQYEIHQIKNRPKNNQQAFKNNAKTYMNTRNDTYNIQTYNTDQCSDQKSTQLLQDSPNEQSSSTNISQNIQKFITKNQNDIQSIIQQNSDLYETPLKKDLLRNSNGNIKCKYFENQVIDQVSNYKFNSEIEILNNQNKNKQIQENADHSCNKQQSFHNLPLLQQQNNNKLYQTMRAYNMKRAKSKRSSSNCSQNTEDNEKNTTAIGFPNELNQNKQLLQNQNSNTDNTTTTNSEKNSDKFKKIANIGNQEELNRLNSKNSIRKVPNSGIGINLLKFPPGFFGDDPFKIIERKKSNDKEKYIQDEEVKDTNNLNQNLPQILEMPKMDEIELNKDYNYISKSEQKKEQKGLNKKQSMSQKNVQNYVIQKNLRNDSSVNNMKTSPSNFLQSLKISKICNENQIKKLNNLNHNKYSMPPILQNNKYINQKDLGDTFDYIAQLSINKQKSIKLIAQPKGREASQQIQYRNLTENQINQKKVINRQASAPSISELAIYNNSQNNFIINEEQLEKESDKCLKQKQKQKKLVIKSDKNKLNKQEQLKQIQLNKAIEKNKFLSRIQESKSSSHFDTIANKPNNQKFIKLKQSQITKEQSIIEKKFNNHLDQQLNEIQHHNNEIQKILKGTHSQVVLQKRLNDDIKINQQILQLNVNNQYSQQKKLQGNKIFKLQQLNIVKQNQQKHQQLQPIEIKNSMQTTFGPQSDQKSNKNSEIKKEFQTSNFIESHNNHQQDDAEMTFGIIQSQLGTSILSNQSLRQSQTQQFLFGQTIKQQQSNNNQK